MSSSTHIRQTRGRFLRSSDRGSARPWRKYWHKLRILLLVVLTVVAVGAPVAWLAHSWHRQARLRDQLEQQHLAALIAHADDELHDPQRAKSVLDQACDFADISGLADGEITFLRSQVSAAQAVPPDATARIIGSRSLGSAIVVDFKLTDQSGEPIRGLTRADVELYQQGKRQRHVGLAEWQYRPERLNAAVLLDCSGSIKGAAFESSLAATGELCETLATSSRIRLWSFAGDVRPLSPWTSDETVLKAALATLKPDGGTALHAALRLAVDELGQQPGPKLVVLLTDGRDSFNNERIEYTLGRCKALGIPIHVAAMQSPDLDTTALQRMAAETHGSYQLATRPADVVQKLRDIVTKLERPAYRLVSLAPLSPGTECELQVGGLPRIPFRVE